MQRLARFAIEKRWWVIGGWLVLIFGTQFIANAAGDPLFHVQVGPFSDKKDAEAMRTRLSGDGYNAIVK